MWIMLALFCAVASAVLVIIGKRLVQTLDPLLSTFLGFAFSVVFLLAAVVTTGDFPSVTWVFVGLALASGALDAVAHSSVFFALRHTPVSVAAPMTSFTPVFAVIAACLLLGQTATPRELAGIVIISGGAYLLSSSPSRRGWLSPLKHLVTDPGMRLILFSSLVWGLTPIIQTRLIRETTPANPLFAAVVSFTFLVVILAPMVRSRLPRTGLQTNHLALAALFGLVAASMTIAGWTAFTLVNPSFVVAIAKLSIIFGVLFGALFFHETRIRERLLGASVMLIGVLLLVLHE